MTDDLLSSATAALRETSVEGDGAGTRLRVRRSLEANHRGRRQLVSFLTATSILLAGTMSWAFATGRAAAVWRAIVDPAPVAAPAPAPAPVVAPAPMPAPVARAPRHQAVPELPDVGQGVEPPPVLAAMPPPAPPAPAPTDPAPADPAPTDPAPAPTAAPVLPAPPPPPPVPAAMPPPARAAAPARLATVRPPVEALYRRAHELHFRGADHAASLAAWDAYLAAEPSGRFVAEARYNRALLLIRVGRYADARTALEPYARGEIAGGYRSAEASRLVERLPD